MRTGIATTTTTVPETWDARENAGKDVLLTSQTTPRNAKRAFRAKSTSVFFSTTFWATRSPSDMTPPVMKKVCVSRTNLDNRDMISCVYVLTRRLLTLLLH